MELSSEQAEYLGGHQWAILSTGRRDGSPQASMIGFCLDGGDVLATFGRSTAKFHNISRQPRVVLSVPDGRRSLTLYGDGEFVERDPERVEAFAAMMAAYGAPAKPAGELAASLDSEGRVILRIHPTSVELHD